MPRQAHRGIGIAAALVVTLVVVGCGGEPDRASGEDGDRHVAPLIKVGETVQGEFNFNEGDRTDWMRFNTQDGGLMRIEVSFGRREVGAEVQVFNTFGKPVTKEYVKRYDIEETIHMEHRIGPGRYFLRIRAREEGDASDYALKVIVQ